MGSVLLVVELLAEVHQPDRHCGLHIAQAPVGAEVLKALTARTRVFIERGVEQPTAFAARFMGSVLEGGFTGLGGLPPLLQQAQRWVASQR